MCKSLTPLLFLEKYMDPSLTIPYDVALKIASFLQVTDLCALGSCSRFWRELCRSDYIWESLVRERWPFLECFNREASSIVGNENSDVRPKPKEWKTFYRKQHCVTAQRAARVVKFVGECSGSNSLEVGDYLRAIDCLSSMQLSFKDIETFLFKPELSPLLQLIGLHYCISWLKVPARQVVEAARRSEISERQVCVRWWKLGRWVYGFRLRDESHYRWVSLASVVVPEAEEVLRVLHRGVIHEVLRVQLSCTAQS